MEYECFSRLCSCKYARVFFFLVYRYLFEGSLHSRVEHTRLLSHCSVVSVCVGICVHLDYSDALTPQLLLTSGEKIVSREEGGKNYIRMNSIRKV